MPKFSNDFPVWCRIEAGTMTKSELVAALRALRERHLEKAITFIEDPEFLMLASGKETYDLIKVSPRSLGFPGVVTCQEAWARASSYDLEQCPPEIGPQLYLQTHKVFMDLDVEIAMKPMIAQVEKFDQANFDWRTRNETPLTEDYGPPNPVEYEDAEFVWRYVTHQSHDPSLKALLLVMQCASGSRLALDQEIVFAKKR